MGKIKHLGTVLFCLTISVDGATGQTGRVPVRSALRIKQKRTVPGRLIGKKLGILEIKCKKVLK